MSDYHPPIEDMQSLLHDVLGFEHEELDRETTEAILGEAAKLATGVLAPINREFSIVILLLYETVGFRIFMMSVLQVESV